MPTLKIRGHERFAQAIAAGKNGTAAYLSAGYALSRDAAARNAYRLRNRDDVKARIAELASGKDKGSSTAQASPSTVETALRKKTGRPSLYRPEYAEQAFKYSLLGATDDELARFFEVSERTIENWKIAHPEFLHALKVARTRPTQRAPDASIGRPSGLHGLEQQAFKLPRGRRISERGGDRRGRAFRAA